MDLEIRRGLSEAAMLASEHRWALAAYVGLGVVLPYLLLSSEPIFSLRTIMAILSDPWTYRVGGSINGPLYLIAIVTVIVAGAWLAGWNALLSEMREGYLSEIMYGMVAGVAYLLTNIVLYVVVGVLISLPIFLTIGFVEWSQLGGGFVSHIYQLASSLLGTWIGARFCLAGPVMGAAGKLEPVSAFIESWRRTAAAQWRLFGFFALYGALFGLALTGLVILHGAVILRNEPDSALEWTMSFGWLVLIGGYFLGQLLLSAGFYRASQPGAAAEVFA